MRKKIKNNKKHRRAFQNSARKTKAINITTNIKRGGFRL